jgi:hypothetical protein
MPLLLLLVLELPARCSGGARRIHVHGRRSRHLLLLLLLARSSCVGRRDLVHGHRAPRLLVQVLLLSPRRRRRLPTA